MALFTDGTIASVQDLADHDSGVLQAALTENIDLTRKLSLAQEEVGVELTCMLGAGNAADWEYGGNGAVGLESIVVSAPLRLWHTFHSLALVYRDAYYSQLNDRYDAKWKEYVQLANWAAEKLIATGVAIAADPVPQAAPPSVTLAPGALDAATYYVAAAWLNGAGEEGCVSTAVPIAVSTDNTFVVTHATAPANARAWNVYAGLDPEQLAQQNGAALTVGEAWLQRGAVSTAGVQPGSGQKASYYRPLPRILQRG